MRLTAGTTVGYIVKGCTYCVHCMGAPHVIVCRGNSFEDWHEESCTTCGHTLLCAFGMECEHVSHEEDGV